MKAYVCREFGPVDSHKVEEIEDPRAEEEELPLDEIVIVFPFFTTSIPLPATKVRSLLAEELLTLTILLAFPSPEEFMGTTLYQ